MNGRGPSGLAAALSIALLGAAAFATAFSLTPRPIRPAAADRPARPFELAASEEDVPKPARAAAPAYVAGNVLRLPDRPPIRLAERLNTAYSGYDDPAAIPAPDGSAVLYHAWRPVPEAVGMPLLRVYELETGRDVTLQEGATTAAWRGDGALAYSAPLRPVYGGSGRDSDWLGHVYVRHEVGGRPVRWTMEPSLYQVWAWAGEALLVGARRPATNEPPANYGGPCGVSLDQTCEEARRLQAWVPPRRRLLALTGKDEIRELPLNGFVAVSPGGRLVAGTVESPKRIAERLRVVEVASGKVVAELDLAKWRVRGFLDVRPGSWAGEAIAAATLPSHASRVLVFRFDGRQLTAAAEIAFTLEALARARVRTWEYVSFGQPLFVAGERELSVRLAVSGPAGQVLTCDLVAPRCRAGRLHEGEKAPVLVHNPSRPLPTPGS